MITLSTQYQQVFRASQSTSAETQSSPQSWEQAFTQDQIDLYKEKIVQCLHLSRYTKGGPFVLEALVLYFMVEASSSKDTDEGLYLLAGNIVQIAMHSGYHRDARHFPDISPFEGEMRRRIWAQILQIDFTVSSQLGLPRLINQNQVDTSEPHNFMDSDFDETSPQLPPSRPEDEPTPTRYIIAKLRLLTLSIRITDAVAEIHHPSPYPVILSLDTHLTHARSSLPSGMRWEGFGSAIGISSQTLIQQLWLEVSIQRLRIVLHKKFLIAASATTTTTAAAATAAPEDAARHKYAYSREVCTHAATAILELQLLLDEETRTAGILYSSRWKAARAFAHDFLLATSTLCFIVDADKKLAGEGGREEGEQTDRGAGERERALELLGRSLEVWLRESGKSREAAKAVMAIRFVLEGASGARSSVPEGSGTVLGFSLGLMPMEYFPGLPDLMTGQDAPGLGMDPIYGEILWQRYKPRGDEFSAWAETSDLQQMDIGAP